MNYEVDPFDRPVTEYVCESPTVARFHRSNKFFRGIRGPYGSGKTVGCAAELVRRGHEQAPSKDGVRRTRWVVLRNTYPELLSTTINTWKSWFPEGRRGWGPIVHSAPIRQEVYLPYEDGPPVAMQFLFMSADKESDVGKLKSLEVTGAWLNEASEMPKAVLDAITSRIGRYPPDDERPAEVPKDEWPTWRGIIGDTNSPSVRHWWYNLAEVERPEDYEFFDQPGGLDDDAENLRRLPGGRQYYHLMAQGKTQEWIDVYINNQYGSVFDGKRVYPEFNDRLHVSDQPLSIYRGLPIYLGWDFGLTPACIIAQVTPRGQLRILEEITTEDMGIENFAANVVKPILKAKYNGLKVISVGDPGGNTRVETNEKTCMDSLNEAGIPTEPANTNLLEPRLKAVRFYLTRLSDGQPAFLLDPGCHMLREGFSGGYHYKRIHVMQSDGRFKPEPEKNEYSHPHDGLQYIALKASGGVERAPRGPKRRTHRYAGPADRVGGY